MKVLFVGGTGIISSACSALAVERGIELHLLLRGKTAHRSPPAGARLLHADIHDPRAVDSALGNARFDAVVNFIAFTPEHVQRDVELFKGRTQQYVFISSASAYQTPPARLPVTESTPLFNPHWQYSRNKIACEEVLVKAYREQGFPMTIVRPSHTYDKTLLPAHGGYTVIDRMRRGKPVIVHGDGSSLWTLTHHRDFARAFVPLLGHDGALGEAIHITSDEAISWDRIHELMAHAAGAEARIVHVPSDLIAGYDAEWGASLLGDKTHSMIFDNTKVKRLVPEFRAEIPFCRGIQEILAYYDGDPSRRVVDHEVDELMDRIIEAQNSIHPV
ncbi:MAG TPA: SDR family oxidoreductase [Polyangiaceae bacterium]|nr:SDR family oxidoreductase [Polyangiaceae bacterium]